MTTPPDRSGSAAGGFEELLREAEELRQQFEAGQDPSAEYAAQDDSGAVQVTIDGQGRVTDVELDRDWEDVVGVDGLGSAVLEAVNNAILQRVAAWETAVAEPGSMPPRAADAGRGRVPDRDAPRPRPAPDPTGGRQVPASAAPTDPAQVLNWLENLGTELEGFERRLSTRLQQETVGRSPGHHVTVTLTGGQVSSIDLDRRWLGRGVHPLRLGEEIQGAFQSAYERDGGTSLEALLGDGPLGSLYALGNDPQKLWGRLAD